MESLSARSVQLEDDLLYRKGCSNVTAHSEDTTTDYHVKSYDSQDTVRSSRPISTFSNSSMRVCQLSSLTDGNTRFPKLQDCAHFHYDTVDIHSLRVCIFDDDEDVYHHSESVRYFYIKITSNNKTWIARRTLNDFRMLDQKLHRCIFDRKFSHLPDLGLLEVEATTYSNVHAILGDYLNRFSTLAGSMLNCGSVLNWLEIDNRGHRLLAVDDSGINTPAIAAAHAVKRYLAQASDEISLEVGDIISVIDMPPTEDTIWWRGKRGFEVGFFPYECVEVIGGKIPQSVVSSIPQTPQNNALLKKHGKFLSLLRMFFNTRPERIQLKQSGIVKERVFGCDLGEHLLNSGHDVPLVLKSCSAVIEKEGLVDGIYRLSGITSNIQKLRLAFDEDRVPNLTSEEYLQDVHSISSLLKMYFRELPNPLLTYQLYDKFANAVKDEDNKLLRIHDVVQQLPPPHYRTTKYLMHHLARVAAHGRETGMHSKNLAIVWAPNLLRSKELESGGGAAALRGVGIQAVVTEFLILYADIIFSDKMPSYSSPDLKKTHKKPRPKSLVISTPTRLLTLEEARERALAGGFAKPENKYIDLDVEPSDLSSKYHTVLHLPGYKKKGFKEALAKGKKSPSRGLKSLFSKNRSASARQKGLKSIHNSLNFDPTERKAITEEDVQHWKRRRIRSAKSAESLLSLPAGCHFGSSLSESLDPDGLMNVLAGKENSSPAIFPISQSMESCTQLLSNTQGYSSLSFPSFVLEDEESREVAVDVNPSDVNLDCSGGSPDTMVRGQSESPSEMRQRQSFVRNESKRRVICHRRTPSAPITNQNNHREVDQFTENSNLLHHHQYKKSRSISQSVQDMELNSKPPKCSGKFIRHDSESEKFYIHSVVLESPCNLYVNFDDGGAEKRKGSKTPPKDRKKLKEGKEKCPSLESGITSINERNRHSSKKENVPCDSRLKQSEIIAELPESPGSKRKHWCNATSKSEECSSSSITGESVFNHYISSRVHDYAEIDEKEMDDNFEPYIDENAKSVFRKSLLANRIYHVKSIDDKQSQINKEVDVLVTDFPINSVKYNHLDTISVEEDNKSSDLLVKIVDHEQILQPKGYYSSNKLTSEWMSLPSNIQKSPANIDTSSGCNSDISSSVTISKQGNVFQGHNMYGLDIQRKSTSLDGLTDESPLGKTAHEFNAKIDKALRHDKHKAQSLREIKASQEIDHNSCVKELISCEDEDEVCLTPTGQRSLGSTKAVNTRHPESAVIDQHECSDPEISGNGFRIENKYVDRPVAELHITSTPRVIRAPLRASKSVNDCVNVATSPTHPSPLASLDVPISVSSSQSLTTQLDQCPPTEGLARPCDERSTTSVPSKTGFSISEEDFQKLLMSDPDSMCQLEQIMFYSPVRFRNKGFSDEKCNRSSVASPLEGIMSRSNYGSPDSSPASLRSHHINRSVISPDASPIPTRLLSNSACNTIENCPKFQQMLNQPFNSKDSSSNSKLIQNQSVSSCESSPQSRPKHNQSVSSCESSPQSKQKHNQSFSCIEASPPSRQKLMQSMSSTEGSPPTRQILDESFSSADIDPMQHCEHCFNDPEASPQLEKHLDYSTTSAHFGKTQSTRSSRKQADGVQLQHERKCFGVQLPELEKSEVGRLVSSPVSPPEHTQPHWDDLACLNESFKEIDMSVFNENWKNCLAPTGNAIRLSANVCGSSEHLVSQSEPEIGIDTDTVVHVRPSIRRKLGEPATDIGNTFQKSTQKDRGSYDDVVPEQKSLLLQQHEATVLEGRPIATDQPTSRYSCSVPSTRKSSNQSAFGISSRQSSQLSIQTTSERSQSSAFSCPDVDQSNGFGEINRQASVHTLLPLMLEEMDVNENCMRITSHQNISNEMKEMLQEQLRELTAVPLPRDEIMTPFSSIGSPRSQTQSFFDASPLGCFDMETSFETPSDIGQLNLPEIHIQILCDGPTVTAPLTILSQLHCTPVQHVLRLESDRTVTPVHQPIDDTEGAFQNALGDNLEWNLACSEEHLLRHISVCEPLEKFCNDDNISSFGGSKNDVGYVDAGNAAEISASTFMVKDTPPPVTLDSMSSSTSSLVDLMSTSYTYPQNFDVGHYYSTMGNSLSIHGDLAPPPQEMIEICKSVLVLAKPTLQLEPNVEILPEHEWKHSPQEAIDAAQNILRTLLCDNSLSLRSDRISERGEEKMIMELRPSLKKKPKQECELNPAAIHSSIVNDTDHVDSGLEDDVFVDPSDVTNETHFFAAGSKYCKWRDFLSSGHAHKSDRDELEKERVCSFDVSSSFSDVELPGSENQSVCVDVVVTTDYHERFMDIRHDVVEDIRLNKAHRSSKLLNLCEKFETVTGQVSLSPETDGNIIKQTITSPEKDGVSSLRQMHESFDLDKRDGEIGEIFGKPQTIKKVSSEENWQTNEDTKLCQSPRNVSNKDMCAVLDNELKGEIKKHTRLSEIPAPSGIAPLHNGKVRTPSELSISESESSKTPAKSSKADPSPPKAKGQQQLCAATEVSFKAFQGKEFSQDVVKQGESLTAERQESSSKIPVFKQSNWSPTKERQTNSSKIPVLKRSNLSEVESKLDSMPINLRQSWGSGSESVLSDTYKDDANGRLAVGRLSGGELTHESQCVSNDAAAAVNCDESDRKKRRGSIKKLTNIFEEKIENVSKGASAQPAPREKLTSRVHSATAVSVTKQAD